MINSLQHIGQGVWDTDKTYEFYKKYLNYKFKINDITIEDEDMARVIGSVETIRTLMAINANGGGALELVEHKSSPIKPCSEDVLYGNYGILEAGYKVINIEKVVSKFQEQGIKFLTPVRNIQLLDGRQWSCTYLRDPDGLLIQLTEETTPQAQQSRKPAVHGLMHAGIGVSNLERSRTFYESVLGFDRLLYEHEGYMQDTEIQAGKKLEMRMIILERTQTGSQDNNLLPAGSVKLIEVPAYKGKHIYNGRRWGDIGFMELGMDVSDLEDLVADIKSKGQDIYLPPVEIDMGSGSKGMIAYIRDPDGTIIELVEVKTVAWLPLPTFMRFAVPLLKIYDKLSG